MNSKWTLLEPGFAALLTCMVAAAAGCNNSQHSDHSPVVISNSPLNLAVDVPVNARMTVTFSEEMDPSTINSNTFTLTSGPALTPVAGTIIYADSVAYFWPAAHLADNGTFDAAISTDARNASGVPLRSRVGWHFNTGTTMEGGRPVNLGQAGGFAVLAKAAISTVPTSAITGDIGVSPAAATFITGFALSLDASNVFATSPQVTGHVYAADYAVPTPANLTSSVLDMQTAFTDAAGRAPGTTELGAGNIGGLTLVPGVYKWGTGLLIPTDVTLNGSATDVWVFQVAQNLTMSSATNVVLTGGALPENIFWQVTGLVDIGTTAQFNGIVLCATGITLQTGASANGRLLAQTAVSLDSNTIVEPTP